MRKEEETNSSEDSNPEEARKANEEVEESKEESNESETEEQSGTSENKEDKEGKESEEHAVPMHRFNKVYGELMRHKRELNELKSRAALNNVPNGSPTPQGPGQYSDLVPPKPTDFPSVEEYNNAAMTHNARVAARDELTKGFQQQQQLKRQQEHAERMSKAQKNWEKVVSRGASKHPDWDDAYDNVDKAIQHGEVGASLLESPHADDIIMHLHKHPEDLDKVSSSDKDSAMRHLGRIEGLVESKSKVKQTKKPPTPISQTKGMGKSSGKSDAASYIEEARARDKKRSRR